MRSQQAEQIGLVIPTLNAGPEWSECLKAVAQQSVTLGRRLVIDSSSTDNTAELAEAFGFEVRRIPRTDFNHGGTRQWAIELLGDCKVVVFLTQDAILANSQSLAELTRSFENPRVAVAYGRQLPRLRAKPIESHARLFNYGETSQYKDSSRLSEFGAKAYFCSNSFSAYRRSTLLQLGGFRRDLILGEDAEYAARAIMAGYINVYCAEALAYHSHDYGVAEVFWRYFDTGVFHAQNIWMRERFGSYGGEGARFVRSELRYLLKNAPWQIPRSILHTCAKVVGYRLGRRERILPNKIKKWLSMTPGYWVPRQP